MKELTIEEKAKAYDKAIEKFGVILNLNTVKESGTIFADDVRKIFPELKESEGERIEKEIYKLLWDNAPYEKAQEYINYICRKQVFTNSKEYEEMKETCIFYLNKQKCYVNDVSCIEKCIAWLEKQGEQKSFDDKNANIQQKDFDSMEPDDFIEEYYQYQADDIIDMVTEKSADKVEPKFKVGEWITNGDYTWKIVEVKPLDYILQSQDGNIVDDTISHVDNNFHIWTIQDAKDGDVLASKDGDDILIFRNFDTNINFSSYYNLRGRGELGWSNISFIPATKEQRETLLKAMVDAGDTFDFEKKKVKKIEAKPDMIQWRGDNLKEIIEFTGKDKNFDKWFKSFAEYEKYVSEHDNVFKLFNADGSHFEVPVGAWIVKTPDGYNVASKAIFKNKPAEWSKENKAMLDEIIDFFENGTVKLQHDLSLYASWLKSLRPQKQWKPSEDQMKALAGALSLAKNCGEERAFDLRTLHEQLEKLREE